MNYRRTLLTCFCLCSTVLALGCSDAPDDAKEGLVPVSGLVTVDGQPVPDGTISFYPDAAPDQPVTSNITNGEYEMNTTPSSKGMAPGKYKVAITAWKTPPSSGMDGPPTEGVRLVPEQFGDPAKSGLAAEVTNNPDGNTIPFAVKSK